MLGMALSSEVTAPRPTSVGTSRIRPWLADRTDSRRTVGLMLSRLAGRPQASLAAPSPTRCSTCVALAVSVSRASSNLERCVSTDRSRGGDPHRSSATSLFTNLGEPTHQRVRSELAWCSPCVVDVTSRSPTSASSARAFELTVSGSCAIALASISKGALSVVSCSHRTAGTRSTERRSHASACSPTCWRSRSARQDAACIETDRAGANPGPVDRCGRERLSSAQSLARARELRLEKFGRSDRSRRAHRFEPFDAA